MAWGICRNSGGGKSIFPSGYEFKSVALGDTWPGFDSSKRIPVIVTGYLHWAIANGAGSWSVNRSVVLSGKTLCFVDQDSNRAVTLAGNYASGFAIGCGGIFLPELFEYNWDALKAITSISNGTVIGWLEKS